MLLKAYWLFLVIMFSGALKALLRMVANHSSVLSAGWSSNARATGRDTWSSTRAWKATSAPCVPFVALVKTISSPTWRWDDLDSLRVKKMYPHAAFTPNPSLQRVRSISYLFSVRLRKRRSLLQPKKSRSDAPQSASHGSSQSCLPAF